MGGGVRFLFFWLVNLEQAGTIKWPENDEKQEQVIENSCFNVYYFIIIVVQSHDGFEDEIAGYEAAKLSNPEIIKEIYLRYCFNF